MKKISIFVGMAIVAASALLVSCNKNDNDVTVNVEYEFLFNYGTQSRLSSTESPVFYQIAETAKTLTVKAEEKIYNEKASSSTYTFGKYVTFTGKGKTEADAKADAKAQAIAEYDKLTETAKAEAAAIIQELEKMRKDNAEEIKGYSADYYLNYDFGWMLQSSGLGLMAEDSAFESVKETDCGVFEAKGGEDYSK
ncbi:MAG: hypothetical protein ACI3ZL_09960 [Candidatus Cryptobacteroides sp.]